MPRNCLEDTCLAPKYVMLNPNDLILFDKIVGKGNRSKKLRELIRNYLQQNLELENKECNHGSKFCASSPAKD